MISDTAKVGVELSEELVVAVLVSFFEHPLTVNKDADNRKKAVLHRKSLIFMSYINFYFLSISVCLIRPIGLTTTFVL